MEIIKNGLSEYIICYSKDASACVRYSAELLQKYLYLSTNVCLGIHCDKCKKRTKEIILSYARNYKREDAKELAGKSDEAYLIKEINEDLCFFANSDRGVMYAVIRFLEDYIHFRCYASDEIDYEEKDKIEFYGNIIYDFPFEYREVYYRDAFSREFASLNMLNSNMADLSDKYGGKVKWFNFHHSFSDLVDPNIYFDEHPEYFSLIDGKRVKEHTELCLSNEDVFQIALNGVKKWIKDNPDCKIFSVSQDEWMGHFTKMACECENCKKIDEYEGAQSGSIITFVNKIAREIKKEYPDSLIHTFAYQYSRKPPLHIIPDANVIVRLCNIECSWNKGIEDQYNEDKNSESAKFYLDLYNWSKKCNRLYIWDYCTNFHNYLLSFPNIKTMEENIKMYKKFNVKGILMQGNFSFGGKGYLDELKSFVIARMLRYDNLNLDEEIQDFLKHYYGMYSSIVYEYLNLFEKEVYDKSLWLYDDSDSKLFSDDIVLKAKKIIDKAKKVKCNIDKYKGRFDCFKLNFDYLYLTRLDLDAKNRDALIDEFFERVHHHHITELFERTDLEYSRKVLKQSRYAKDRDDWVSLYYIMK